jgi:aspartyl/asparaginyl-tRNA synthetase
MLNKIVGVLLVLVFATSCGYIFLTDIGSLKKNPRDYTGKEITISGEVTSSFSLIAIKYFAVKDSTGEIVVVTEKPIPKKGDKVRVKGFVKEAFSIADQNLVVIMESKQNN